ncbi:MAG: amidohydrolase family protein, partial [Treponema sp.]|nr:amidohydrolase family protein [Treponema sp.]
MDNSFFLNGDICWSSSPNTIETAANSFLLCLNGKTGGVFREIPKQYAHLPVKNYSSRLIIPGLTDLHVHASQFAFRALGMDMELLEWLDKNTFPEEAKYRDNEYARKAYSHFVEHIRKGPNTRLCVFASIYESGTLLLMDLLEESGLVSFVGKVSMDRNCPEYLCEKDPSEAVTRWLTSFYKKQKEGRYKNTAPILTPRFIPSCSDKLMRSLAEIQGRYGLPLQSHLSENRKEIEWVKKLCPNSESYAASYADSGLLGAGIPTIMAHCVWPEENEMRLLAERKVYIAHCPQSNTNLSSGIAPVRRLLDRGISLGLGSDIAGGANTSIFRAMTDAIQVSKLRSVMTAPDEKALTLEEAFYMGTIGGGSFFGERSAVHGQAGIPDYEFGPSGSFESGRDFDALVIDDSGINGPLKRELRERLEQVVYLSDDRHIIGKYVRGIPL